MINFWFIKGSVSFKEIFYLLLYYFVFKPVFCAIEIAAMKLLIPKYTHFFHSSGMFQENKKYRIKILLLQYIQ